MRMFVTPLGNFSRLIRNPVSLMLWLLLDDELFADPTDDVVDELDDDFWNSSLGHERYKRFIAYIKGVAITNDIVIRCAI